MVGARWVPRGAGGRLFIADGLFDISYGPEDVVLLDGNIAHGITCLCDLPGGGKRSRQELERFSAIVFSSFKREGGKCGIMGGIRACGRRATAMLSIGKEWPNVVIL